MIISAIRMHAVTVGVGTSSDPAGGGHHHYPKQSDWAGWPSVGASKGEHSSRGSHGDETFVSNLMPEGLYSKSAFQLNMEKSGLGRKSLEEEQGRLLSLKSRDTR